MSIRYPTSRPRRRGRSVCTRADENARRLAAAAASARIAHVESLEPRQLLAVVTGAMRAWQPVTLDFAGPSTSETATAPNPFLDYRLQVRFTHAQTGTAYDVPGFFDGNGAGGGAGNVWRAKFAPDRAGDWSYVASFRHGSQVAIDLSPTAGTPTSFDGDGGTFTVAPRDAAAPGFARAGRIEYAGGHYFKHRDGGYWIKGGAGSPEDWLGYSGFDNTPEGDYTYANHVADWRAGDPDWNNGAGKGIIGAVNYLSNAGANAIYFLPMNVGGDAQDTHPWVGPINHAGSSSNDNLHYDISKLRQWGMVFDHADRRGVYLHFVLNEAEAANKRELDNGLLGAERKLYYRELVARFGHGNGLQWNISEEYDLSHNLGADNVKAFAGYIQAVDPYDHPVTVHNYGNPDTVWHPFVGDARFSATSFQDADSVSSLGNFVQDWRAKTTAAGRPIPIMLDEIRATTTTNAAAQRKDLMWNVLMSGSGGVEWYMGATHDRNINDFRPYGEIYRLAGIASRFMQTLPLDAMAPSDALVTGESTTYAGGAQVLAAAGSTYAIYYRDANNTGSLDLRSAPSTFALRWFNPRTGLFEGTTHTVQGGTVAPLGPPPSSPGEDWVALLTRSGVAEVDPPAAPSGLTASASSAAVNLAWSDHATNENGFRVERSTNGGTSFAEVAVVGPNVTSYADGNVAGGTTYTYRVRAYNGAGTSDYSNSASATTPAQTSPYQVTSFTLVNADTDRDIMTLTDGAVVNVAQIGTNRLNIRANATSGVKSVRFGWNVNANYRLENGLPYAMAGNTGSDYFAATFADGSHTVTATPYSATSGGGTAGPKVTVTFTVGQTSTEPEPEPEPAPAPAAPGDLTAASSSPDRVSLAWTDRATDETGYEVERSTNGTTFARVAALAAGATTWTDTGRAASTTYWYRVRAVRGTDVSAYSNVASATTAAAPAPTVGVTSLSLLRASTGAVLMTITDGMTIDLASLPSRSLAVRAETAGSVGSVRFGYNATANFSTENNAPFAMHGDSSGKYKAWTPAVGTHTITATAYSLDNASGGLVGTTLKVTFRVIDSAA